MAPTYSARNSRNRKSSKQHLDQLIAEANQSVKPYPDLEVNEKIVWTRTNPRGRVLAIIGISLAIPLVVITLYGVLSGDRSVLLAVLDILKFTLPPFVAGVAVKKLWGESPKGSGLDEKNQDSG
jgi:hypothetical protein